ncbi:MAG TPA: cytochrome d ubiquinol oxidase subunit II [Ktedonobacterales bacterium]
MTLNTLWFILIATLFTGFFLLEGFDYGVGILLPVLGRDDADRRMLISSIGPFWDGNEVWLLTAGGAMFAAFPNWYATLFSGFYLPLALMLLALIVRGVAFEFRNKDARPAWRATWDWMIFIGSFVPALLWGVALSNIISGVPIDAHQNYVGGFWNLLNPYALLGGITFVGVFTLYGAIFLALKADNPIGERAHILARLIWLPVSALIFAFVIAGYFATDVFARLGVNPGVAPLMAAAALISMGWLLSARRHGWAFIMMAALLVFSVATLFLGLFPRVMVSSLNPAWDLTITNASSSPYTLTVMSIIALTLVPIVVAYQAWNYYIFRQRVTRPPAQAAHAQQATHVTQTAQAKQAQ